MSPVWQVHAHVIRRRVRMNAVTARRSEGNTPHRFLRLEVLPGKGGAPRVTERNGAACGPPVSSYASDLRFYDRAGRAGFLDQSPTDPDERNLGASSPAGLHVPGESPGVDVNEASAWRTLCKRSQEVG